MAIDWKTAAVGGVVVLGALAIFKPEVTQLLNRFSMKNGDISIAENLESLTIENTIVTAGEPFSPDDLMDVQQRILDHTIATLGMHPVAFSYFIRSARCSYFNRTEENAMGNIKHFEFLHESPFATVWHVDNAAVQDGFGGPGLIVAPTAAGKLVLHAYEADPDECPAQPGAIELTE